MNVKTHAKIPYGKKLALMVVDILVPADESWRIILNNVVFYSSHGSRTRLV